jgi:5-methyltetrahydrofolate--homocysteine methyltransferase
VEAIRDITAATTKRIGGRIAVAHTDLGGNLDILASLRGSNNLLLDLVDAPEEVDRLVGEVTKVWLRYYDELQAIISESERGTASWAPIWSPGRCYMFQCDLSYILAEMFRRCDAGPGACAALMSTVSVTSTAGDHISTSCCPN